MSEKCKSDYFVFHRPARQEAHPLRQLSVVI